MPIQKKALKKQKVQALNNGAEKVVELGELLYSIETINSYEYQKDWVDLAPPAVEPEKDYYDQ